MGYDVTNNSSVVELGPAGSIPSGSDITPIALPVTIPTPELIATESISQVTTPVQIPTNLPSQQLVGMDTITPVGDTVTIPAIVPADGIILLESFEIAYQSNVGITKMEDLIDVNIGNRTDNTILVYDVTDNQYHHELLSSLDITFDSDIDVSLSSGKSLGKYINGDTIPTIGKTIQEILIDIATDYIKPAFQAFSVTGQATTVEVGTSISGSRTFTWTVTDNDGQVDQVSIYDITNGSYLIEDTIDDGTQAVSTVTENLFTDGATQQWRMEADDVGVTPPVQFNSSTFTVTARYYRYYGPSATSPVDSADVKALGSSSFQTGNNTFTLNTNNTLTKFVVALPPGYTIVSVIDLDAARLDVTEFYEVQTSIDVDDANSTPTAYNIYEMNISIPYTANHRHEITTS